MTAKQRLQTIRRLDRAVERRLLDIEQVQTSINRVTSCIRKVTVQGGQKSNLVDSIDRLISAQQVANEAVDVYVDAKEIVVNQIDLIEDPLLADILHARYVLFKEWADIAKEFKFSEKYVTGKLHNQALEAYAEVLTESGEIIPLVS